MQEKGRYVILGGRKIVTFRGLGMRMAVGAIFRILSKKEMYLMGLLDELKDLGVNVEEGLGRLGGNAAFYEKMLGSFIKMMNKYSFDADFDCEDYGEIIEKAHAIKGASGNLSITPIYEAYGKVTDLLRKEKPFEAKEVLQKALPVQEQIMDVIKKYKGEA